MTENGDAIAPDGTLGAVDWVMHAVPAERLRAAGWVQSAATGRTIAAWRHRERGIEMGITGLAARRGLRWVYLSVTMANGGWPTWDDLLLARDGVVGLDSRFGQLFPIQAAAGVLEVVCCLDGGELPTLDGTRLAEDAR